MDTTEPWAQFAIAWVTFLVIPRNFEVGGKAYHPDRSKVVVEHVIEELVKGVPIPEGQKIAVACFMYRSTWVKGWYLIFGM